MTRKKNASKNIIAVFVLLVVAAVVFVAFFYIYMHGMPALFAEETAPRSVPVADDDVPQPEGTFSAEANAAYAMTTDAQPLSAVAVPAFAEKSLAAAANAGATTVGFVCAQQPFVLAPGLFLPHCALLDAADSHAADHERRDFASYSLCYRESYEVAEWSAYCLERAQLVKNTSRTNDFRADPAISTGSASLADYRRSGYDRGHLAPAADFAYDASAMSDTFYLSNMTPQAPAFNRGIWQQLEAQVRLWVTDYGRAYVVTGPVLDAPASDYDTIGENAVAVPRAFYKVVLLPLYADDADAATPDDCAALLSYAFIIPNEKCVSSFYSYAVTIDEVEARTGIDFFHLLDDAAEAALEAGVLLAK